jgi:hypothetical protein
MTDQTLNVIVQYTREAQAVIHVRPYDSKLPVSPEIKLGLTLSQLPVEGHSRVEVEARVTGINTAGVLCYEFSCLIEGIAVSTGMKEAELDIVLRHIAAPAVIGAVRSAMTTLSGGTGYVPVMIPPVSREQLALLAPLPSLRAVLPAPQAFTPE